MPNDPTLREVRQWVRENRKKGCTCPGCGQHCQEYNRTINAGMARSLIAMYQINGTDWVHVPTQLSARSREEGKLRFWGLIEEDWERAGDGNRTGYWRLTEKGERFVRGGLRVPKHAKVYNNELLELDYSEQIDIREALGNKFNYEELMNGE